MIRNKNIAMIGEYPPTHLGGVGSHIQGISRELQKQIKIMVITIGTEKKSWQDNQVQIIQEKIWYPYRYTTLQVFFQTARKAWTYRKIIDLYHVHGAFFAGVGFLDKRKPLVLTIHGYLSLETVSAGRIKKDSLQFEFMRWVEKISVKRANAIITVGNKVKEWIINELEAEPNKVFYIPNGVDTTRFMTHNLNLYEIKLIKKKFGLPENSKIILFTKHFTPRYGIQYAVHALSLILKKDPHVILVSTNEDNYLNKTRILARDYGVDSSCIFTGRLSEEDLIKLYNISDVFIHLSIDDFETFGISLIEAMSCRKPVISTAVGGPKEILENGKIQMGRDVGILIPPEDVESIAESVIYLLCHPEEAREMGKRAREYVLRNYSSDLIAEKTLEVYNYVLANRGFNRDDAGKGSS